MSRAECGIIGLCPMLTKDSKIKNCDECENIEPVCVNCKHDYHDANGLKPNQCWTCCNGWKGERFTENHFEPK